MLRHGLEAGDIDEAEAAAIEARIRTGRPLGDEAFVERLEASTGRTLKPQKRGPKAKARHV
jgi:putative transposase